MVSIVIYQKNVILPEGNCYIIARDGVYLKKDTGLISAIVKVDKLSFLENIIPGAEIKVPPIPLELFVQIRLFFREVYKLYKSESIVLLYYNDQRKKFKLIAPPQIVGSAQVSYASDFRENGFKLVGSIHSHADFSAFHSGIDQRDEAHFDGLHITVGNVNQKYFSISTEVVVNNNRFPQESKNWIIGLTEKKYKQLGNPTAVDQSSPQKLGDENAKNFEGNKIINEPMETEKRFQLFSYSQSTPKYDLNLPEEKTLKDYSFPEEWLLAVKRIAPPVHDYFDSQDNSTDYNKPNYQ